MSQQKPVQGEPFREFTPGLASKTARDSGFKTMKYKRMKELVTLGIRKAREKDPDSLISVIYERAQKENPELFEVFARRQQRRAKQRRKPPADVSPKEKGQYMPDMPGK
jgi:hypothetical protein